MLAILILPAFLTDFGMTFGAGLFVEQAKTFHMSVPAVANSISGGIFLQGPGGLFAVPLTQRYGRLPVLFWSQLLACVLVVGASLAPTYAGFTACRTLQGLFNTPPQVIGLTIIHDLFFFHERTRKINIWAFCFLVGPYFGPFMSYLVASRLDWRQTFGVMAAMYFLSLCIVVTIGQETLYDRDRPVPHPKGLLGQLKLLTGWHGASVKGRPTVVSVSWDILLVQIKPHILLTSTPFHLPFERCH
jgi:MFS family permease